MPDWLVTDAGLAPDVVTDRGLVEPDVFGHLDHREKNGYERIAVEITFESGAIGGTVYRAAEGNPAFLGPAPLDEMAAQINRCAGPSGSNRDEAAGKA